MFTLIPVSFSNKPIKGFNKCSFLAEYRFTSPANTSKEKNANIIVVGLPLTLRGKQSKQTEIVQKFIEKLAQQGKILVIPIDERLSSIAAKKSLQQQGVKTGHEKGRVDETAAAIILQEYLDSQS